MESSAWLSGSNRATRLALSPRQLNRREGAPLRPSAACRRLTSIALWQSHTASLLRRAHCAEAEGGHLWTPRCVGSAHTPRPGPKFQSELPCGLPLRSAPRTCPSVTGERKRPSPSRLQARLTYRAERSPRWGRLDKSGPRGGAGQLGSAGKGTKAPWHLLHLPGGGSGPATRRSEWGTSSPPQTRLAPPSKALPPRQASLGPKNRHKLEHRLRGAQPHSQGPLPCQRHPISGP